MGAWSHEPFGNDTACDWAYELEESQDFAVIEAAFDELLQADDEYVDADIGSIAHAAAEVLAKALGQGTQTDAYTEKVDQWLARINQQVPPALVQKAIKALNLLRAEESELNELWGETDEHDLWIENIEALKDVFNGK
ncbi:uncharacterized protein DUF4259 [Acinetobacter calcoaceticus]|uniref:Uncharacterized protein DUF4259 n=1 Tax=Acinetobacter calcoaceticus TaxID=471 RepID=A0A4R1XMA2_ACICA|nr:uncharacterized protein DUF4259 [Acinetobacter calcoaceticus]